MGSPPFSQLRLLKKLPHKGVYLVVRFLSPMIDFCVVVDREKFE